MYDIKIDRRLTEDFMVARTREQAVAFRRMYCNYDILRMFLSAVDREIGWVEEIHYCHLTAFPGGTHETDETHYRVDMMAESANIIYKIYFYISQSGEVDTREIDVAPGIKRKMWDIREYKAD